MNILQKIQELDIPVVRQQKSFNSIGSLIDYTKPLQNEEGFVISFDSGHKVKIKADQYVLIHRILDKIKHPRHILLLAIDNQLDDVIGVLPESEKDRVKSIEQDFWKLILRKSNELKTLFDKCEKLCGTDGKCIALKFIPKLNTNNNKVYGMFLFSHAKNNSKTAFGLLIEYIKKQCISNTKFEQLIEFLEEEI